jgi:hypothetical protein
MLQVAPAAVLLALRLHLQAMLLQAQLEALLWDVNAPVREASRIRDVLEPMGVTVSLPTQGVRSVRLEPFYTVFAQTAGYDRLMQKEFQRRMFAGS